MDNKIYITNFWHTRNNYGANLTAFALQNVLQQLGFDNKLINNPIYTNEIMLKKCFGFKFQQQHLITTQKIDKNAEILNSDCEIFITGSDQVFRPIYTQKKLDQYMLDFATHDKKKIAFSASFGLDKEQFVKENSQEIIEHMKNSLKSFDFISVREKSGVEICKDVFDVEAQWIIDPVFILDKSKYDELIENVTPHPNPLPQGAREESVNCHSELDSESNTMRSRNEFGMTFDDKIVAYVLDTSKEYKKAYKYLEKKYDTNVIETANSNISVESWLKSIRDCKLFVTDSFHGMCFAMIFNKPFICLANKSRGRARFDSICEMLCVENQCIDSINEVYEKDCVFKVDYNVVNERIEQERQKGLEFLKTALEAPVKVTQKKIDSHITYLENRVKELETENNLKFQLKKYLWDKWLVIYHCYLPMPIKSMIHVFWQMIKGLKKGC